MKEYVIPNLRNACIVLAFVSDQNNGCSLSTICKELNLPRTSALRITQTLIAEDFLAKRDDGSLVLGSAVVQLGVKALDSIDIRGYARPVLQELTSETNESSHLAMLNGSKAMLVEVCDSPKPVRIAARPGTLVDLHSSATGKLFLAHCISDPASFCAELNLTVHTDKTDNTVKKVLATIERTRKQGYGLDDEEYLPGVRCIAAPVINAFGKTVDAIGITASTATFKKKDIPAMAARVQHAANAVSQKLGYAG